MGARGTRADGENAVTSDRPLALGLVEDLRQDRRQARSLADHFAGVWVGMRAPPYVVPGWRGVTPPVGPYRDPPHVKVTAVALGRAAGNATHLYIEPLADSVQADRQVVGDRLIVCGHNGIVTGRMT